MFLDPVALLGNPTPHAPEYCAAARAQYAASLAAADNDINHVDILAAIIGYHAGWGECVGGEPDTLYEDTTSIVRYLVSR